MALTSRSGRTDLFGKSATGAAVGPGSYGDGSGGLLKGSSGKYSVPPFSSSVERGAGGVSSQTPGPGHYNTYDEGDPFGGHASGSIGRMSSQFASKTARMQSNKKSFTPGPGSYTSTDQWGKQPHIDTARSHPQPKSTKIINWVKVSTAPSIPAPSQSYGYEEGTRGELVPGKPPIVGHAGRGFDTAGPGEYEPTDSLMRKKAPGMSFGACKSARGFNDVPKQVAEAPGPGHYNPGATQGGDHDDEKRPSGVFASATKRSFVSKNAMPGPGTYDPPPGFAEGAVMGPMSGFNQGTAFGTTLPKDQAATKQVLATPGPGQYRMQSNFDKAKDKWGVNHGAFSTTAVRFGKDGGDEKQTPGPGHYADGVEGQMTMMAELGRRVNGRYGVFGSTAQRFPTKTVEKTLGPGCYDPKTVLKPAEARRRDQRTSAFISKVARIGLPKHETPGVGDYMSEPPTKAIAGGFVATELRFKPVKPSDTPGPGEYMASHGTIDSKILGPPVLVNGKLKRLQVGCTDKSGSQRATCDRAVRFPASKLAANPGPGHYETRGTLLKRTFNITIGDTWD